MTNSEVINAAVACTAIRILARLVNGMVSVGLNALELVVYWYRKSTKVGIQSAFLLDPAATSITVSWVSSWVNRKSASGNSSRGFWVRATGPPRSSSQYINPNAITFVAQTCNAAISRLLPGASWAPTRSTTSSARLTRFDITTSAVKTKDTTRDHRVCRVIRNGFV